MLLQYICRNILISFLVIITFSGIIAQPSDIKFEHISLEQGLSQSIINTIMKDSKGFMLFGTESGLNKYDGYEFVIYKNNPFDSTSISNNLIQSTFEKIGHKSSQLIIDDLVEEVDKWRNGNSPNDDVTFVVLKVKKSN